MLNRRLHQASIVWSGRYKNGGVLFTARPGRNGRRQEQEGQNRRLRQATVVWSGRYETVEHGAPFAPKGMADACSRKGSTGSGGNKLSFGVANTRTVEDHTQNTRLKCGVDGYREREVCPHHCGKETIGDAIRSGGKHTDVHPLLTQASPPSGCSRGSRKRARHSETTSTASERVFARKSTGGAVTMRGIDRQKSPVNRDSTVKTEVQLYW